MSPAHEQFKTTLCFNWCSVYLGVEIVDVCFECWELAQAKKHHQKKSMAEDPTVAN